jgi:hypothetical protein
MRDPYDQQRTGVTPQPPQQPKTAWQLAMESFVRTFLQAAIPVFIGAVSVSKSEDITLRDFVVAAAVSAGAAGIAALMRTAIPIQTDRPGVYRESLKP